MASEHDANERHPFAGEPQELPIDGCLDLHQFSPRDVKDLVPDYLEACLERGILDVRIVHGKGIGVLRTIVQGILERHPAVEWFGHRPDAGSWGATLVRLRPEADDTPPAPGER
ncbi:MAG: Smr/MutS family protein [Candidatus Krumholzibacteriia bacterium]